MAGTRDELLGVIARHPEGLGFNQLHAETSHVVSRPTLLKRLEDLRQQGLIHWSKGRRGQRSLIRLTDTMKEIAGYQRELQDLVAFCIGYVGFIIREAVEGPFPKRYADVLKHLTHGARIGVKDEKFFRGELAELEENLGRKIPPEEFVRALVKRWAVWKSEYAFPHMLHEFTLGRAIPFSLKYPKAVSQIFPALIEAYTKVSESMVQSLKSLLPRENVEELVGQSWPVDTIASYGREPDETLREYAIRSKEARRLLELYAKLDKSRKLHLTTPPTG